MEISIGRGIGELQFGMYEEDATGAWGPPDKRYTDEYGDVFSQFHTRQTVLKFEKENEYRLGWIEVYNATVSIFGQLPWQQPPAHLIRTAASTLNEQPEIEDYGAFESVTFTRSWLEMQFELGRLRCINFGVLFDDDDQPIWPNG